MQFSGLFTRLASWTAERHLQVIFCAGGEIWCFDYWSALELGALRKYQSAPPRASEMEDKHMLE